MFSIIIPLFNASDTIVKTLHSCIEQSVLPKEIIIVDDCSEDASVAVVKQWKEKYKGDIEIILETLVENSGPSKARNRGWELATGEYVAFLDADDQFLSNKLEVLALELMKKQEIMLLGHSYSLVGEKKNETKSLEKIFVKDLLLKNLTTTPSVIVKRNMEERFDETMRYTEDHDLWLRITVHYDKTYFLDSVLTSIGRPVRSKGGQSANLWEMRKGEILMYKKFCKVNGMTLLFPFFVLFALAKHFYKAVR